MGALSGKTPDSDASVGSLVVPSCPPLGLGSFVAWCPLLVLIPLSRKRFSFFSRVAHTEDCLSRPPHYPASWSSRKIQDYISQTPPQLGSICEITSFLQVYCEIWQADASRRHISVAVPADRQVSRGNVQRHLTPWNLGPVPILVTNFVCVKSSFPSSTILTSGT